jgi:hypothetical protein
MLGAAWLSPSLCLVLAFGLLQAQAPPRVAPLTDAQIEQFLLHAKVTRVRGTNKGVTLSLRATLSDGTLTHEAHIQQVDESRRQHDTGRTIEFNFRDSWMFNVAAYRLDRLIGLNMVPVSISRRYRSEDASFTWWVDDVLMEEGDRLKKKIPPPHLNAWNQQMQLVRLFDQLIANTDRNVGNLVISKDWRIWPIDHTRAFRLNRTPGSIKNVTRCDRQLLENLKHLDRDTLRTTLSDVLTNDEIDALLARRDAIVTHLQAAGPAVLFTRTH